MAGLIIALCFLVLAAIWAVLFFFVAPMALPALAKGLMKRKDSHNK